MTKRTNTLTKIALMAALQCIISPFAIAFPISPVPMSLATLMLYLSVYILGKKHATISCGIYLLIGLVGIPVFSGFTGGAGKLLGPTGGYLIGYLALTWIGGWCVEKWSGGFANAGASGIGRLNFLLQGLGLATGTVVCYLFGTLWLAYQAGMDFVAALGVGVLPFIIGDVVKIVIGVVVGNAIRKRLVKAGVA